MATVCELISEPSLHLDLVVDGLGLDRPIRWVHTTEMSDPGRYLEGGEVILSSGLWPEEERASFVRSLAASGVAALGYGPPGDAESIPGEIVTECRKAGLTLFRVPFDLPYIAISKAFFALSAAERELELQASLRLDGELVESVNGSHGPKGVLTVVARRLPRPMVVLQDGQLKAFVGDVPASSEVDALWKSLAEMRPRRWDLVGPWLVMPVVSIRPSLHAFLLVSNHPEPVAGSDRQILEHAVPFVALELAHAQALVEKERRFAAELFDLLDTWPTERASVMARLKSLGIDLAATCVGCVCKAPDLESALGRIEGVLTHAGLPFIAAVKTTGVNAIIQPRSDTDLRIVGGDLLQTLGPQGVVGVGRAATDGDSIASSITEAREACRVAELKGGSERCVAIDEVASHSLLLALADRRVVAGFQALLLQPLIQYDDRHRSQLVETLRVYLDSACHSGDAAARLHLHVNTLRYRLARIEELTGRDLSSMEDRVDFFLGLRAP